MLSLPEQHLLECELFFNKLLLVIVLQSKAGSRKVFSCPAFLGFYPVSLCWVPVNSLYSDG